MLEIRLFGKFDLQIDNEPLELASRKAQALLAYLLLNPGVHHRREKLAGLLWPDSNESKARSQLRYALWQLRNTIGKGYFLADKISIAFDPEADYWLDVAVLDQEGLEDLDPDDLQRIVSVYVGELLPGFYDDWVIRERDRLQASYEQKIQFLVERLIADKRWQQVLKWGEDWISLGGFPEPAFRALMIAHSHLEDVSSAVLAYQRCVQTLDEQLGVEPSDETRRLYALISGGKKPELSLTQEMTLVRRTTVDSDQLPAFLVKDGDSEEETRGVFVARESQLADLNKGLEKALAGRGGILFVVGGAGLGKTALLSEFGRRAQREYDDLLIAFGNGEAHTGSGDPHLPFRDVLALLTGDVETKWEQGVITRENARRLWHLLPVSMDALMELGPDLIDSFVSNETIQARASIYSPRGADWLQRLERYIHNKQDRPAPINIQHRDLQKDLFEQYTKVLQRISSQKPLLIVLDDLHWADLGSIDLLFHLGRRIEGQPILIVGVYRPDELVQERDGKQHPLIQIVTEFKRKFGDIVIDLDHRDGVEGRQFVEAFLNTEPNRLGEDFRQTLYSHTGGHPLFTIELLRQMQSQGDLRKDKRGRWIEGPTLNWDKLPVRVEAVIAGRISRLPDDLKDVLSVASVEGQQFTAEVIARVKGIDESAIVHQLSQELDKRHLLVEALATQRVGQQRFSLYRFSHHLFQKYVYDSLDSVQRALLHERVGNAMEELYKGQTDRISVRLARHFEEGGVPEKASDYLLQAAELAKKQSANPEAIAHLSRALNLLKDLPDNRTRRERELALQISLGAPLVATKGYTAPEAERTFERVKQLCEQMEDISQLATALWFLWSFYLVRAKYTTARNLAEQIYSLAQLEQNPSLMLVAHWTLGITLVHLGEFLSAREMLDRAIETYDSSAHHRLTYLYGQNPGVTCLIYSAFTLWFLGYPDHALQRSQQALKLAKESDHPYSLSFVHGMLAVFHALRREVKTSQESAQETIKISKEAGFPFLLALGLVMRGWARAELGKTSLTTGQIRRGIEAMRTIGSELGRPIFQFFLAQTFRQAGQIEDGLSALGEAIELVVRNGEHLNESELFRLRGELLETQGAAESQVITSYQRAVEIARRQHAKSLELRALLSMSRFWENRGQRGEMQAELADIYAWFTEGFDTADLEEARERL